MNPKIEEEERKTPSFSGTFEEKSLIYFGMDLSLLKIFCKLSLDAFRAGKVLASNPRLNHAAALFGTDGENYLFKDSGPGYDIQKFDMKLFCNISPDLSTLFWKMKM